MMPTTPSFSWCTANRLRTFTTRSRKRWTKTMATTLTKSETERMNWLSEMDGMMPIMTLFVGKVFCGDALNLLRVLPDCSIDACIIDLMYGTSKNCRYDWGVDPAQGDPVKHWQYHEPIYRECLRVLKPGGVLAWAQGFKFVPHFDRWFGPHRIWSPICWTHGLNFIPNTWVVQT